MLLALLLFLNEGWYSRLLGDRDLESRHTVLGRINVSSNDVRYKQGRKFDWQPSSSDQQIYVGDSIFVGPKSRAAVRLNGKSDLQLGENSLIKFSQHNGQTLSDLLAGNFRLQIDGQVQIAINGQVTTLKGEGSEVQVYFDKKNQPKMKLLKGEITVTAATPVILNQKGRASLKEPRTEKKITTADAEVAIVEPPAEPIYHFPPEPLKGPNLITYNWQVNDIYEFKSDLWSRKIITPQKVHLTHSFTWSDAQNGPYQIEYGSVDTFDPRMTNQLRTEVESQKAITTDQVYLGDNFWRVSRDGKEWSTGTRFVVVPTYLAAPPKFAEAEMNVWLVEGKDLSTTISWSGMTEQRGYFLEGSSSEHFPNEATQIYWKKDSFWKGAFKTAGTYYFRVRAVNTRNELTDFSATLKVRVDSPSLLTSPSMPLGRLVFTKGENKSLNWKGPPGTRGYTAQIFSKSGRLVREYRVAQNQIKVSDLPAGEFQYRVLAIDEWGRAGERSRAKAFSILNPKRVLASQAPPPAPTPVEVEPVLEPAPAPEAPRSPLAASESVVKLRRAPVIGDRNDYNRSLVQIEGASLGVISSEQLTYGTSAPLLGTIGIRGHLWRDRFGAEASMKMKAFGYNSEAERVSPTQLEARIHHRWTFPWRWFSFLRELQASVFGGAEVYRNSSGGTLYSSGYELAKGGVTLRFPLGKKWDSGGELAYGLGLESSSKYEASGNVNYFFKKEWSFGVGYRVHYFQAGSSRTTPFILPYREAQGEAFSVLRYSY